MTIAEMTLNGMLCVYCGTTIGDAVGYPINCDDCSKEAASKAAEYWDTQSAPVTLKSFSYSLE